MMTDALGWLSSAILLLTIGRQVWKQWRTGMGEGVSMWLYIGQVAASAGFTIYSVLVENWVFIVTNSLMMMSAVAGLYILLVHCRRGGAHDRAAHGAARERSAVHGGVGERSAAAG